MSKNNSRELLYYAFDRNVPYKGLSFRPIKVSEYFDFHLLAQCLTLERTSEMAGITMSYLEYLVYKNDEKNNLIYLLDALLRLTLGKQDDADFLIQFGTSSKGKPLFEIGGTIYDSNDFDAIREIIAEQNCLELPDEMIQKNVRDTIADARRYKARMSGTTVASIEDQMIALSLFSGIQLRDIYEFPIRKFIKAIRRANHMILQNIYMQASVSGMVEFKDKKVLTGWLADLEDSDKDSDVTMSLDALQGKADFSDAK
jgi:hypothetical protein